jgi:hypothetical protein
VIGLTWSDEASAQAALLVEALTDAGLVNVVPVRLLDAIDTLARAIAPVIGYEQTAVCILGHESATVVMVDTHDGETQSVVKQVRGGLDGLSRWLRGMFERRTGWRPGGVVVVGADSEINGFSWQLEKALPVRVFAQSMAQVTIARGAALAAARSTDFTDEQLAAHTSASADVPAQPRKASYTGPLTALAGGALTFISSLSLAVGIQLAPDTESAPAKHVVHAPPQVAEASAPAVAPPPAEAAPPAPKAKASVGEPAPQAGAPGAQPSAPAEQQPDPNAQQPYLTRVLDHIPGDLGDSGPHGSTQP